MTKQQYLIRLNPYKNNIIGRSTIKLHRWIAKKTSEEFEVCYLGVEYWKNLMILKIFFLFHFQFYTVFLSGTLEQKLNVISVLIYLPMNNQSFGKIFSSVSSFPFCITVEKDFIVIYNLVENQESYLRNRK